MIRSTVPPDILSDEDIARRVLAGEKELYEIIMRRHNPRLFRICRSYIKDGDEVEDIVQQAHINAYAHLSSYEGRSGFSTWLTRIAINEAMARLKQRRRSVPLEEQSARDGVEHEHRQVQSPARENPDEAAMHNELRGILERTIDELPLKYRSVFVMREIEGMSVSETSQSLGISMANVKVRLNRAKEMLRRSIDTVYHDTGVYHFDLVRCDRIVAHVMASITRYEPVSTVKE